jgi:dTDP-glucose 4,6-dehydratase/UDP-glucose 4-epimerase
LGIWVRQLLEGTPIKVFGDGEQLRDFNYVDDCVNALLLAGANEQANGQVYNLGSPEVIGLKALAEKIVNLGFGGSYELVPFPEERKMIDIGDYYSDFSLISMELGWLPEVNLQKGLLNTIEYYSKHKSAYWGET